MVFQMTARRSLYLRMTPILILALGLAMAFYYDLHTLFTFEALRENRLSVIDWKQDNYTLTIFAFVAAYGIITAISLPGATWMTIAGGFMFGAVEGGLLVLLGATVGATVVFLAARHAFAGYFRAKVGSFIFSMEKGFRDDAISYLLVLRLVPLFPFWLVNLVPAFLSISTPAYIVATFFGIIPGVYVYASLGSGLGNIFDQGGEPDISIIWSLEILLPLLGLSALALVPVIYRKFLARGRIV